MTVDLHRIDALSLKVMRHVPQLLGPEASWMVRSSSLAPDSAACPQLTGVII